MTVYGNKTGLIQLDVSDLVPTLTAIKVSRLALGHSNKAPKVTFDLGADMKEVETAKGRLKLRYTLYVDAIPAAQRAELEGTVTISSASISAVTDLQTLGEEKISEIALQIYRKNYELLYLLFETEGLSAPSPWLIQDVQLVAGEVQAEEHVEEAREVPAPKVPILAVAPIANA